MFASRRKSLRRLPLGVHRGVQRRLVADGPHREHDGNDVRRAVRADRGQRRHRRRRERVRRRRTRSPRGLLGTHAHRRAGDVDLGLLGRPRRLAHDHRRPLGSPTPTGEAVAAAAAEAVAATARRWWSSGPSTSWARGTSRRRARSARRRLRGRPAARPTPPGDGRDRHGDHDDGRVPGPVPRRRGGLEVPGARVERVERLRPRALGGRRRSRPHSTCDVGLRCGVVVAATRARRRGPP